MNDLRCDCRRLRIALVVHDFTTGGAERCVARLLNGLDRERFHPFLVCVTQSGNAEKWIRADDVEIVCLGKAYGNDPRVVVRFKRFLEAQRIEIVHSHNWGTLVETSLARRWARVPIHVHAERGLQYEWNNLAALRRRTRHWVTHRVLRFVNRVVVPAHAIRNQLISRNKRLAQHVDVIPNGVETPRPFNVVKHRLELRARLGIKDDALVVGSIGRLVPVKGFATAIRSIGEPYTAPKRLHLMLVGEGPERQPLVDLARRIGVADRVHFLGVQDNINAVLAAMDIYVNTSHSEGMSQSILEAMAMGLPMVATNVGDNEQLVCGAPQCGEVVPVGAPGELARALSILAGTSIRNQYGLNALHKHTSQYTVKSMNSRYEALYLRLASAQA